MIGPRNLCVLLFCSVLAVSSGFGQALFESASAPVLEVASGSRGVKFGKPVTLRTKVPGARLGQRVTFLDGATVLGTASFNRDGEATFTASSLPVGRHSIRALAWGARASIASRAVAVTVRGKQPTHYPNDRSYPAGPEPGAIVTADFNGDGNPDVAVANINNGSISVLLGKADGSFTSPIRVDTAPAPSALATGDFDGNGIPDLVVADSSSGRLAILLGNGDGTFVNHGDFSANGVPTAIAVSDFNGDGIPDLAIANQSKDCIGILLGNGDSTFRAMREVAAGSQPSALVAADFNRDGFADLAVVNLEGIAILLGAGDSSFRAGASIAAGEASWLSARDSGKAANVDLLLGTAKDGATILFAGNGNGTFQPGIPYSSGLAAAPHVSGDFNHDGRPALAVADGKGAVKIKSAANGPDLVIDKFHDNDFYRTQIGAEYFITVSNDGNQATSGTVTVTDTLPAGLTATAMSGPGWSCTLATLTCTRSDVLFGLNSYPDITLTVNVASNAPSSVDNVATVSGGGDIDNTDNTITDSTVVNGPRDLTVSKSHNSNFFLGQTGAQYFITVFNAGGGPTDGSTVTVTDTLPAGLTATAISGSGWTCTLATLTCTRTDVLLGNDLYPDITLTVNVASNASSPLVNSVSVSGGGDSNTSNNTGTDSTVINGPPDLTIQKAHVGNFFQTQTGAQYFITVNNTGGGATNGSTVTVVDTLPAGLTATAMSGSGWSCTLATLTCTRTGVIPAPSSYPTITLTVSVASNASSPLVNSVSVSGGGETNTSNNTATDSTIVNGAPDLNITKTHAGDFFQGQTGAVYNISVRNIGGGPTNGSTVTVTDTLPTGLTATAMSGTGWSCTLATLTCTRTGALAVNVAYPVITLTVNVASNASSPLVNSVTVSAAGEINTSNNTANDSTVVNGPPDLQNEEPH